MTRIKGFANLPLLIIGAVIVVGAIVLSTTNLGSNVITGPRPGSIGTLSAIAVSSSQINLSWTSGVATDGFEVERSLQPTSGFTKITSTPNTSYSDAGLTASTTYYYRVRPFRLDRQGKPTYGSYSNVASATTLSPPPPLSVSASVSPQSIIAGQSATWTAFASGGTDPYTYSWSGSDGLFGSTQSLTKTYASSGVKVGIVAVTSGTQTKSASTTLVVTAPPPPSVADLGVPSTSYVPTSTRFGDRMSFSGVIKNFGSSAASSSEARLRIDIYSNGSWDILPANEVTPALAPGASAKVTWFNVWGASFIGTHTFEICADANGSVPESYETNNCGIQFFAVSPVGSPPHASSGPSHLLTASTTHMHDGGSASDPDGNLSSYEWSFWKCYFVSTNTSTTCPMLSNALGNISGGSTTISVPGPTFTPLTTGTSTNYKLLLKVWDTAGWVASSTTEEKAL